MRWAPLLVEVEVRSAFYILGALPCLHKTGEHPDPRSFRSLRVPPAILETEALPAEAGVGDSTVAGLAVGFTGVDFTAADLAASMAGDLVDFTAISRVYTMASVCGTTGS